MFIRRERYGQGKRARQSLMVASDSCPTARRLFLKERDSAIDLLINTGAILCAFSRKLVRDPGVKTEFELSAANGTNYRYDFTWNFVIADVSQAIIGVDFLFLFDLLVDLRNGHLLDRTTSLNVAGQKSQCATVAGIKTVAGGSRYNQLLQQFLAITRPDGACKVTDNVKHKTVHHIHTTPGQPVAAKPRCLPWDRLNAAKEFESMLRLGVCRPSEGSWASPLHMVPK
nr:uncharacterized protein LOC111515059 [Leptinotarsa decemlineata]